MSSLAAFAAPLGVGAIAMSAIMAAAWLVQRRTGNSCWIDAFWTFGTGLVAAGLALAPLSAAGTGWRHALVAAMAALWSLRLGLHIVARTRAEDDDPRYKAIIAAWGVAAPVKLFRFLQAQALVAVALAASIMVAAHSPRADLDLRDGLAILVFAGGWVIEATSDAQLRAFKSRSPSDAVCDTGMWAWSRHPNYFGEWLCWCAYPLLAFAIDYPAGWASLLAPAIIYWTLVYASGIPPLEAHMRKSRPEAWAAYASRTPAFFPRLPRR